MKQVARRWLLMPLALACLRAIDAVAIANHSLMEMRRSAPISQDQTDQWRTAMLQVIPDARKGDQVMGVHRPGEDADFRVNRRASGEIRDAEFARRFFGIWLSPNTPEPRLRAALLTGVGE